MEEYFEIQHFAHPEHPLILTDFKKDSKAKWCRFCCKKLLSSAYSCVTCYFHLHKLCAKLPEQMIHPNHDAEHPLTLIRSNYYNGKYRCNICLEIHFEFSYRCESCDFDVDVGCACLAQAINHKGHPHPLYPLLDKALFKCGACGKEHSAAGVSYQCRTCAFWVHEDCATLPTTVKYHGHVHPLSLFTYKTDIHEHRGNCHICRCPVLKEHHWIYQCYGCRHPVHVNCLATTLLAEISKDNEVDDDDIDSTKVFQLPESFQYDDLITQMIKHMTTTRNYKVKEEEETAVSQDGPLSHFSHQHPLTLISSFKKKKEEEDLMICNACVLPVSTVDVYYTCTACNNHVLHEWCAKLPNQLPLPDQPWVTLTLRELPPYQIGPGIAACLACRCFTDGYIYCGDGEWYGGEQYDIKCVCLPPYILHKAHQHPLKILHSCHDEGCVACPRNTHSGLAYGCKKCCFFLHDNCALQPITIVHRYDVKHPFILRIDAPIKDGPDEYVCEFCEEDIDPMWWFYHCLPCDLSACVGCIFKEKDRKSYINPRLTCSIEHHNHPLTYIQVDRTNKASLCSRCHQDFVKDQLALQCVQCNIMFHGNEKCTKSTC